MTDLPLEHVYAEPQRTVDGPGPAVVVLHGRGADERDLLPVAQHLPDELAAISLRAPEELMGGYTWYELHMPDGDLHRSQPEQAGFRRSLDAVSESIEAALERYDVDPDRLGLLGFSQGAIMTFSLLLEGPGRFRWASGHHGYLADVHADLEPEGLTDKPVFVGAGTADQLIPPDRAEAAAARLRELGCAVTFETYPVGHGIATGELEDLVAFVESNY